MNVFERWLLEFLYSINILDFEFFLSVLKNQCYKVKVFNLNLIHRIEYGRLRKALQDFY